MPRPAVAKKKTGTPDQRTESREEQIQRMETQACDVCSAPMTERACRYQCAKCGYQRDCEDP